MRYNMPRVSFALGLIALGIVSVVYDDFALQWQPVPAWVPARGGLAYVSGLLLVAMGTGLVVRRTAAAASRVLLVYLVLWLLLLKLPAVVMAPLVEVNWLGFGEIAMMTTAGLVLVATLNEPRESGLLALATGERAFRIARFVFALALLPVGLSHFVYAKPTIGLVPAWLPYREFWAYLGGAGHIAAGLGVLLGIYPYLAATLEAAMIGVFTLLVWLPGLIAKPTDELQWTAFLMSYLIGAAAWVVAGSLASRHNDATERVAGDRRVPA